MTILSKARKSDNFQSHNSLKLSFMNIRALRSNFCWLLIFPWIKFSWHSCYMWDKPGWLKWFWQFPCERLSSFSPKDFSTHMYGLAVSVKEGYPFARDVSLENCADSHLCFRWLYFTQCLTSFSSMDHLFCLCARFLIPFHLTQMRFSPSTHLLMCLPLETLTSIIRTDLPILVELIDLVNIKWPYPDGKLSYSDPRLWFSQSCSFGFLSFFWH